MINHTAHPLSWCNKRHVYVGICCYLFFLFMLLNYPFSANAMTEETDDEEISVSVNMPGIGTADIAAIIHNKGIYLNVGDLFDFLKIYHIQSVSADTLSGFLLNTKDTYLISKSRRMIVYQEKQNLITSGDMISTPNGFYLRSDYFGKVFNLNAVFHFRSLSVDINTKLDLPVIREMRQQLMRHNINRINGIIKADTMIKPDYPDFKIGMIDWSVLTNQQRQGINYTGLNLSLGGVLAGGETNIAVNYNNYQHFKARNQFYSWRYVNNDNPVIRQVMAGKVSVNSIASIYAPVIGFQVTNTPSLYRTAFGSYKISDVTEPGWKVELYVNNVLVDFKEADASGFFSFNVPLVYGNTLVDLRFYGPWGEERSQRRNVSIPFNFLPKKEFEYNFVSGVVEDDKQSIYAKGNVNYGFTNWITVGGGLEYLMSIESPAPKSIPFLNTSLRITQNLLIFSEYAYHVRTKSILNYRLPSDMQIELNYIVYDKDQRAVLYNYQEERKAIFSFPLRSKGFTLYSRLAIDQVKSASVRYTNAELIFSGVVAGVNTNLTTYSRLSRSNDPVTYSILAQTYRLQRRYLLTPQLQYQYEIKQVTSARFDLERAISSRSYVKLTFERNFFLRSFNTGISLRCDLSFARISTTINNRTGTNPTFTQAASGSFIYDKSTDYFSASNNSNVGKAGFSVLAYLDLNSNGHRDQGEPKAAGLSLRINGGIIQSDRQDTIIRILNLEPYRNYLITLNPTGFDNIAWQIKNQSIGVMAEPNQLKLIEVPVSVASEVSGMVYFKNNEGQRGLGRIKLDVYNSQSKLVKQILSESDGYFNYLGLNPGKYTIILNDPQLNSMQMKAKTTAISFTVKQSKSGDIVDGLEFFVSPK